MTIARDLPWLPIFLRPKRMAPRSRVSIIEQAEAWKARGGTTFTLYDVELEKYAGDLPTVTSVFVCGLPVRTFRYGYGHYTNYGPDPEPLDLAPYDIAS